MDNNLRHNIDPGYQWESDKLTVRHHKREPLPARDHKAHINQVFARMIKQMLRSSTDQRLSFGYI